MSREIHLNAFDMNCVTHLVAGTWRHPDSRATDYKRLSYWTELAQVLERGLFDSLFIADVLGVYDVYAGSPDAALRSAAQVPVNDPLLLVPAMAAVTSNLGFGVTASTSFEHPYPFARRMSSLDHLTDGRIGWNIVTGYLESGARNMGLDTIIPHDTRYDIADEYLEVVYKLWEGSWDDDAVVADTERGVYVEPGRVHPIEHRGPHFTVPGIHLSEPSPQRTPLLFQAGASSRGKQFGAENAEVVFLAAPTADLLRRYVADIRTRVAGAGRREDDVLIVNCHTVIVAETDRAAKAKHDDLRRYLDPEGTLALWSGWLGFDLSAYDLDDPIEAVENQYLQSTAQMYGRGDWTLRDLVERRGVATDGTLSIGSPATVADDLERWVDETGIDGFNLAHAITPGSFVDFVDLVVPELQRRGRYKTEYAQGTLRDKLFGQGPRLPERHRAAGHRRLGELTADGHR
jgi:FMN-dependent oxidoreductase (nitrilotriacetate monooxygenase family)